MLAADIDSRVVKALAHPTRVRVLQILDARGMASPVELSGELSVPLGTMGYHVRRLEVLGMIELAATRPRRGATEHFYRPASQREETAEMVPAALDSKTRGDLVAVMREVEALARAGAFDSVDAQIMQRVATLDSTARRDLARALADLMDRVIEIQVGCAARRDQHPGGRVRAAALVTMDFGIELDEQERAGVA